MSFQSLIYIFWPLGQEISKCILAFGGLPFTDESRDCDSLTQSDTNLSAEADDVLPQLFGLSFVTLSQRLHQLALLPLRGRGWFQLHDVLLRSVAGQAVFGFDLVDEGACRT